MTPSSVPSWASSFEFLLWPSDPGLLNGASPFVQRSPLCRHGFLIADPRGASAAVPFPAEHLSRPINLLCLVEPVPLSPEAPPLPKLASEPKAS